MMGIFNFSATDLLINKTAAAPSDTMEAFPAVVDPPFLKAGFNLASPSTVVVPLIPSSLVTVTSFSFPSLSNTLVYTGTISSLNNPSFYNYKNTYKFNAFKLYKFLFLFIKILKWGNNILIIITIII